MKRLLSAFLLLVLFTGMLPVDALAVEDDFRLSDAEVLAIQKMCGHESSHYRKGMSFSASMTGWQMYSYLLEFKEDEAANVTSRCTSLNRLLDDTPAIRARSEMEGFDALPSEIDTLNSQLNYFIFQFDEQIRAISGAAVALKTAGEKEKAGCYRRLQKADIRLRAIMDELAGIQNSDKAFTARAASLNKRLDAYSAAHETLSKSLLKASQGPSLLQSGDFHFVVLDLEQIGFVIYDENKQALPGAKVKIVSGEKTMTVTSDEYGIALFQSGYFELDDRNRMTAEVYITAAGKRIYESHALHLTGGEGVSIYLQKDNGESYIQYMDFRGIDILHETETVYTTPANDASQPFTVGIHAKPGHAGSFSFLYTEADTRVTKSIEKSVSSDSEKVIELDLSSKWCSMLEPNMAVTASFTGRDSGTTELYSSNIAVKKAAVEVPLPNIPLNSAKLPGTQLMLNLPMDLPGLQTLQVGFNFPTEIKDKWPISFVITPEGYFSLGISVTKSKEFLDDATSTAWKTNNSLETAEKMVKLIETRETLTSLAEKGIQKRNDANAPFLDLCKTRFDFSFAAMLTGTVNPDKTELLYDGALDLLVTVAGTGNISFSEPLMLGPVPLYAGFDFSIGIMAGVNFGFKFKTTSLSAIRFQDWSDFEFNKEKLDIIISPRAAFSFYGGVGAKNVLGFYIRAYSNFAIVLHFRPAASKYKFIAQTSANIGAELVLDLLFVRFKATFIDKTWTITDPDVNIVSALKGAASTGLDGAAEETPESFVRAQLTELPSAVVVPAGMEVFSWSKETDSAGSYLGVYKTEKTINGIKRPWLDVAGVFYKVTEEHQLYDILKDNRLIPQNTASFGKLIWPNGIPDDAYLYDYAATSIDDVVRDGVSYKIVALALVFARHADDESEGIPTNCMGEMHYYVLKNDNILSVIDGDVLDMTGGCQITEERLDPKTKKTVKYTYTVDEGECPRALNLTARYDAKNSASGTDVYHFTASWVKTNAIYWHGQTLRTDGKNVEKTTDTGRSYKTMACFPELPNDTEVYIYGIDGKAYDITKLYSEYAGEKRILVKHRIMPNGDVRSSTAKIEYYEDIVHIEVDDYGNSKVVVLKNKDNTGKCDVAILGYESWYGTDHENYGVASKSPVYLDARLSPAELSVVNFGATRALYYVEQSFTNVEETGSSFGLKAVYLADGSDGCPYISKPFYLAKFDINDVPVGANIVSCRLFKNPNAFLNGIAEINMPDGGGGMTPGTYLVEFQETLQVDIRSSAIENPLLKAGEIGNLMFNVKNTGNVPVSKFSLSAYAVDTLGERRNLSNIVVDCVNPVTASVSGVDGSGTLRSLGKSSAAVSECDYAIDEGYSTLITSVDGAVTAYATNVLMPGETRCYRATFRVPEDFDPGEYDTYVKPVSISTVSVRGADGRLDSTAAWVSTMKDMDSAVGREAMKPAGVNDRPQAVMLNAGLITVTALVEDEPDIIQTGAGRRQRDSRVTLVVEGLKRASNGEGSDMLSAYANRTTANKSDLDLTYADLSIQARRIDAAGEEQAHIVIQNDAATSVSGLVLTAEVDGEETFTYPINPAFSLNGSRACSMDIPMDTLTGGRKGESLILSVSCASGDLNAFNNKKEILLQSGFIIAGQPKDRFVDENDPVTFDVLVRGGEAPYGYQWQWSDSRNGGWKNIKGANDRILSVPHAKAEQNGLYVRCLVKDETGTILTSEAALLTVSTLPVTGDKGASALYAAGIMLSLAALIVLLRRKRA